MKVPLEIRRHSVNQPWTYSDLDRRQREVAARVREGGEGAILLSEVSPVITMGRRTPASDVCSSMIETYSTDRGGLATYHGPGQWVLFLVERMDRLTGDRRGIKKAVCGLLEIAAEVGRNYSDFVEIRSGAEMGAWSRRGKFAAVGIHVEQGVLLHGLSVNGFKTVESFQGLRPCGLDAPVDYLLGDPSDFEALGQRILDEALKRFWPAQEWELGSGSLTSPWCSKGNKTLPATT